MLEIVDSNQYGSYLVELMEMFRSEWSDLEPFTTEINGYPIPRPLLAINDGKLVGGLAFTRFPIPKSETQSLWVNAVFVGLLQKIQPRLRISFFPF